ncbi:SGNH/GDSL hydrolase family protein [Metabacillus litoralis]|uniref:SGNH/GDSL hydrolase family protein n=1 Tax=Metabacillus litoralis TaxID=152268 RepID=A0A5C6W222_9BACI|nr:SGNH/GDSL hydrolase family protein [Metabacillus litoralis]TXC90937.1 SGNH/GDSL hydrolase family protein [Metabacillus litoralis]
MKKLFVLVTLILCVAAIIVGNLHWNQKITAQGEKETSAKVIKPVREDEKIKANKVDVSKISSNLPIELQDKIKSAQESKVPLSFVIYGSSEIERSWSEQFSSELKKAYGEDLFNINILTTGDSTTRELVNSEGYQDVNELKPDILLFEAPMLNDNGDVGFGIDESLDNIQIMIDSWYEANNNLFLMVQPSQPLYGATFYPSEVSQLQDYMEKNDFIYLNHWENWPELNDDAMLEYLEDNEVNEEGYKIWADYNVKYFVAE